MRTLVQLFCSALCIVLCGVIVPLGATAAEAPPNVVFILADDFGVGDIQAHYPNNKIATPYLDQLVREGMSFSDAHSPSAVCSPTRYGILTGRYSWRTRLQEWVIAAYEPPLIAEDVLTLPAFLAKHGYRSSCIGKWHLGFEWQGDQPSVMNEVRNGNKSLTWDFTKAIRGGPTDRGFDYYFGVNLPNQPPFTYIENGRVVEQPTESYQPDPSEGIVLPRHFTGAPAAPGWRLQMIVPELTRRAVQQVHQLAKRDQPFFLFYSMTSPHEPIVPSEQFRGQSGIAPIADFVMETDWSAGQVIKAVDDAGIADNTVVIFTADNGHSHYTGWQDLIDAGHLPSGPYRGHKGDIWEGGHRVPLVVRWPKRVKADSTSKQLVSLTDLFATMADVLEADLPSAAAQDSASFLSTLLGNSATDARNSLISHSNMGEFAYRQGPWKLVYRMSEKNLNQSRGKPTVAELYQLDSDIAESKNLAEQRPKVLERMTARLEQIIEQGASRPGASGRNDTQVSIHTTQTIRWAPATP